MNTTEYLDAARQKLGNVSDYALAKRWNLTPGQISAFRKARRPLPLHAIYKLAFVLDLEPATVIADLESQSEKDAQTLEFWRWIISRQHQRSKTETAPDREPYDEDDVVAKRGIEPRTRGFSVRCSTN